MAAAAMVAPGQGASLRGLVGILGGLGVPSLYRWRARSGSRGWPLSAMRADRQPIQVLAFFVLQAL
jgi:hypothetical protein